MSVSKILTHGRLCMALQTYQNFVELTSNMIYIAALGVGMKCPRKIHLNTQCPPSPTTLLTTYYRMDGEDWTCSLKCIKAKKSHLTFLEMNFTHSTKKSPKITSISNPLTSFH